MSCAPLENWIVEPDPRTIGALNIVSATIERCVPPLDGLVVVVVGGTVVVVGGTVVVDGGTVVVVGGTVVVVGGTVGVVVGGTVSASSNASNLASV